jgi:hypothetical protein
MQRSAVSIQLSTFSKDNKAFYRCQSDRSKQNTQYMLLVQFLADG